MKNFITSFNIRCQGHVPPKGRSERLDLHSKGLPASRTDDLKNEVKQAGGDIAGGG